MVFGLKFNLLPNLEPGETVRFVKPWIWLMSSKSLPSYRIFFPTPPLWEAGLYVTDRRLLFVGHLFRLIAQEFSVWYGPNGSDDVLQDVQLKEHRALGSYIEFTSEVPEKMHLRSRQLRIRLYVRDPLPIYNAVQGTS